MFQRPLSLILQRKLRDGPSSLCGVFKASREAGGASNALPEMASEVSLCRRSREGQAFEKIVHYFSGEEEEGKVFKNIRSSLGCESLRLKQTGPLCRVFIQESGENTFEERKRGVAEEAEGDTAAMWAGKVYRPLQLGIGVPMLLSTVVSVALGSPGS